MDLAGDLRISIRSLWKAPAFSVVAILSLAVGIGINTAVISVISATMLRPVPGISLADRIVEVLVTSRGREMQEWTYPDFQDVRAADTPLEGLAGWKMRRGSLGAGETAEPVQVMFVSANYFDVLGVVPARGRAFGPSEDVGPGQHPVAVVSHAMWRDRLGGGKDVIGRIVTLNRTPYTVVGVASESFRGHRPLEPPPDLWVPLVQSPFLSGRRSYGDDRKALWLNVLGRLRPGSSAGQATAAIRTVFARLAQQHTATNEDRSARAVAFGPLAAVNRTGELAAAGLLAALAGLVLVVICANIAGMMLARGVAKVREVAVRMALGASSGRLARQLMADALVLAVAGGGLGIVLAFWAVAVGKAMFVGLPNVDFSPDWTVLAGSVALVLVATLAVGVWPAFRFSRPAVLAAVSRGSGSGEPRVGRLHRVAASAQTAIALLFLATCALFVRAVDGLGTRDLGFVPHNLLTVELDLAAQGYDTLQPGQAFLDRVSESVAGLPGVTSVAYADGIPMDLVGNFVAISRADRAGEASGEVLAEFTRVGHDFFTTVGTPLVRGRGIERGDSPASEPVAVITRSLAERLWPGEDPLGKQLRMGLAGPEPRAYTVVGTVGAVASSRPTEDWPHVFVSLPQHYDRQRFMLVLRTAEGAPPLTKALQAAVLNVDARFPNPAVTSSDTLVLRSSESQRVTARAAGGLGLLALLLSASGVYGVVRFAVTQRTREFGIRFALGATQGQILRSVLRDAVRLAVPGVIIGGMLAVGFGAAVRATLLGVDPMDPIALAGATAVLLLVVLAASQGPALR
ncbi:MAG: ADOP family duplicated permease, partial [Vicinamibacterales bacterium]|nr:ADOP family duplicated permease [Vicinamibacterales bacterium]